MSLKKELPILIIVLIPFIYLFMIWDSLPETVPTHWNFKGEIDDWGSKSTITFVCDFKFGRVSMENVMMERKIKH